MKLRTALLGASTLAGCLGLACAAYAADAASAPETPDVYPYIDGVINLELDNDWIFNSNNPANEFNNLYLHGNSAAFKLGLSPVFSANLGLTLEQVKGPFPPKDCTLCGLGLYMDTLNVEANLGNWTFTAGKYEPVFGFAWDVAPGPWGARYAEEYELAERIALGAAYTFDTSFGKHTLAVNTFFADTTVFSESLFNNRGRLRGSDGGAGNTEKFDNFSVTLAGEEIPGLDGFKYNIGYRHQTGTVLDAGDENGFVAGLAKETEIGNDVTLGLVGELAYFKHYGGAVEDATYATVGGSLKRGPWHGDLTGSFRDFGTSDRLIAASVGYEFENGYDLSIGYGREHVAGDDNDMIGVRLTKCFSFSTRSEKPEC